MTARLTPSGRDAVRRAEEYRHEILRWAGTLSKRDKTVAADVPATAQQLFDKVESLATTVAELDREMAPGAAEAVESEIASLEAQANPFDRGSEDRIRRLAHLKRQRKAIADIEQRRERAKAKLEECLLALENMKFDVLKLRAGSPTMQQITLVTEKARDLANEVEARLYAADEMAKLRGGRESGIGQR